MEAIELKNVSFRYPNGTLANENLNLCIRKGERVAIIGQNGAGKTTAVKLMNGLNKPTEGDVLVNGINTKEKTTAQISNYVGYVFQNPDDQIFNNTVKDELQFWPKYKKLSEEETKRRVKRAVELTGIKKYFHLNPYEIPYSTKKFVSIAAVLVAETPYIVLDEPTAGQDLQGTKCLSELMDTLQAEEKTVITITHDMEFVANNFSRVIVMANKRIIADDNVRNIFANEEILKLARIKKPQISILAGRFGFNNLLYRNELVNKLY